MNEIGLAVIDPLWNAPIARWDSGKSSLSMQSAAAHASEAGPDDQGAGQRARSWSISCSADGEPYVYDADSGELGWYMVDPDAMTPFRPLDSGKSKRPAASNRVWFLFFDFSWFRQPIYTDCPPPSPTHPPTMGVHRMYG